MENNKFLCPFCNSYFVLTSSTYKKHYINSGINTKTIKHQLGANRVTTDDIIIEFFVCPNCSKSTVKINGTGDQFKDKKMTFNPNSSAKIFPDYIPKAILDDYEEACSILELSPKASATLSRRCLQSMIRNFFNIKNKRNLFEEINAIEEELSPEVFKVLNAVRSLGNIGAHMQKDINLIIDIDKDEANKLITLIEYLLKEWYISKHESELLFSEIIDSDKQKNEQKKNKK